MPAALVEIIAGMFAGNLIVLHTNAWCGVLPNAFRRCLGIREFHRSLERLLTAKVVGALPPAWLIFRYSKSNAGCFTLMMATGLTFGTISGLYGLTHHYFDRARYTALVTVVILTAIVPTVP